MIKPLGDRVLVERIEDKRESGIIVPEGDSNGVNIGVVQEVGEGKKKDNGEVIPINISKGDKIVFSWGEKVEYDGKEYQIVSESSILGVIK